VAIASNGNSQMPLIETRCGTSNSSRSSYSASYGFSLNTRSVNFAHVRGEQRVTFVKRFSIFLAASVRVEPLSSKVRTLRTAGTASAAGAESSRR
jgi:hypothetical protein